MAVEASTKKDQTATEFFEPPLTFSPEVKSFICEKYDQAKSILEYGSGGSTVYAARHTKAKVKSVESDYNWIQNLENFLESVNGKRKDVELIHEFIGRTGKWGYPLAANKWIKFPNYPMNVWEKNKKYSPDLVLIDGRFRLGCLAATMLNCKKKTTVLFDDYISRERFAVAEHFFPVIDRVDRMASFEITPRTYKNDEFLTLVRWFFNLK